MLWRKQEWAGRVRSSVYTDGFRRQIGTEHPCRFKETSMQRLGQERIGLERNGEETLLLEQSGGAKR